MNSGDKTGGNAAQHLRVTAPSAWIGRFAPLIPSGGTVLDLACGRGRHAGLLLDFGYRVLAVDKATAAIRERLGGRPGLEIVEADLEDAGPVFANGGVLEGRSFAGIVVSNYLHRPLLNALVAAIEPDGVLIYETFGRGNEAFSKPRNPDHLLNPEELIELCHGRLRIVAYEHGIDESGELPAVKSRICAVNRRPDAPPLRLAPSNA